VRLAALPGTYLTAYGSLQPMGAAEAGTVLLVRSIRETHPSAYGLIRGY
jgi:hypothetical protein